MTMSKMIGWFQFHYPQIKTALQRCSHSASKSEVNPYHIEDDCWSHTMMVCKMAEINTDDRAIMAAALLHDIGKPQARRINPRNNHVQFFGHEALSATLSEPILAHMVKEGMLNEAEAKEAHELVAQHGFFYRCKDVDEAYDAFVSRRDFFVKLSLLVECDHLGRFADAAVQTQYTSIAQMITALKDRFS